MKFKEFKECFNPDGGEPTREHYERAKATSTIVKYKGLEMWWNNSEEIPVLEYAYLPKALRGKGIFREYINTIKQMYCMIPSGKVAFRLLYGKDAPVAAITYGDGTPRAHYLVFNTDIKQDHDLENARIPGISDYRSFGLALTLTGSTILFIDALWYYRKALVKAYGDKEQYTLEERLVVIEELLA